MDAGTVRIRRMPFALRVALMGTGIAAAAVVGSLLGAAPAHAADASTDSPSSGLLGGIVGGVTDTAESATSGVSDLLGSSPVAAITAPVTATVDTVVVETVAVVPVAGTIVTGVVGQAPTTSVVAPVSGLLDETLGAAVEVVDGAGGALVDLPSSVPAVTVPVAPGGPVGLYGPTAVAFAGVAETTTVTVGFTTRTAISAVDPASSLSENSAPTVWPTTPAAPPGPVDGREPAVLASSTGSGSGGSTPLAPAAALEGRGAHVFPARGIHALPDDDDVPTSAVHDTDSSPD